MSSTVAKRHRRKTKVERLKWLEIEEQEKQYLEKFFDSGFSMAIEGLRHLQENSVDPDDFDYLSTIIDFLEDAFQKSKPAWHNKPVSGMNLFTN